MAYKKRATRSDSEIIPDDQEMMEEAVQDYAYAEEEGRSGGGILKFLITTVVIVILIVCAWLLVDKYTNVNLPGMSSEEISGEWHAVFLTSGQVYFGQIEKINDRDFVLSNVYYLQVIDKPLQQTQEVDVATAEPEQEIRLNKITNEMHGPEDTMNINRDHILLYEELRNEGLESDSPIITSILAHMEEQVDDSEE